MQQNERRRKGTQKLPWIDNVRNDARLFGLRNRIVFQRDRRRKLLEDIKTQKMS